MDLSIYDLTYDFVQENGHSLVFIGKDHRPLESSDLAQLPMKMIQSNSIPYMLPLKKEEIDFRVRLHYEITSKRMLNLFLREHALTMNDYYALFLNIIAALEDSRLYMLNQEHYLLNEDFIFVGKNVQDVRLVYLPVQEIPGKPPLYQDLKELLVNVAGEVEGLEGEAFKEILSYVKDPSFGLAGLKELLFRLQSKRHSPLQADPEEISYEHLSVSNEIPEFAGFENLQHTDDKAKRENFPMPSAATTKQSDTGKAQSLPALTQREKIFLFAFGIIALACIWKLYGSYPGKLMLDVCAGLSLLVIVYCVIYWKVWRPGAQKGVTVSASSSSIRTPEAAFPTPLQSTIQPQWEESFQDQEVAHPNKGNYYETLHENTTLLSVSEDTVMLGEDADSMNGQTHDTPYFIKDRNGETERIPLHEMPFVIGRNPSAQYVEGSEGVSRAHLEITRREKAYAVRDLGSKNGTRLNEQVMVSYKLYALVDGDRLQIGSVTFNFRAEL